MNQNRKNIKKTLTAKILITFILFNIYHCNSFCNDKNIKQCNNHFSKKCYLYQKYHENYCKYFNNFQLNKKSQEINQNLYPFEKQNSLSEIQISNDFINVKNTYLTNYNNLVFQQLRYQFKNKLDIYTISLGYRKNYYNQWIIGNNIFYDTLLSSSKKDNIKFLSAGSEFFKYFIYVTINTYYNISDNNNIQNKKKYLPVAYDVYIQNYLPFITNIYTKINMEYYINNKKHEIVSVQKKNITKHFPNNNICKVILGLTYVPTPTLTFNIDKIFFNSLKNREIKFNIIANYKISIPWIYQTTERKENNNQEKQLWSISDKYEINRNHSMILTPLFNVDYNTVEKNHIKKHKKLNRNASKKNSHKKSLHSYYNKKNKKNNTVSYTNSHDATTNKSSLNNPTIIPNEKLEKHSELTLQSETSLNNTTTTHPTQIKNNKINGNNKDSNDQTIELTNIDDCNLLSLQKISKNTLSNLTITNDDSNESSTMLTNIPPPPPISNIYLKNYSLKTENNTHSDVYTTSNNENLQDLKTNIIIKQHKQTNFSSIGSEQHLLKLQNILKQRKKTISTSSNDSNDSESIKLLKIIERQSILLSEHNDTDNSDSEDSDNNFSE